MRSLAAVHYKRHSSLTIVKRSRRMSLASGKCRSAAKRLRCSMERQPLGNTMGRWTTLIDEMVEGRWINPETGKPGTVPYERVVIDDRLDGREADLVTALGFKGRVAVVCDENTDRKSTRLNCSHTDLS